MVVKEINMKNKDPDFKKSCLREAKIMEKLSHPNIVKSYEVYKTKSKKLCIVMVYAEARVCRTRVTCDSDTSVTGKLQTGQHGKYKTDFREVHT